MKITILNAYLWNVSVIHICNPFWLKSHFNLSRSWEKLNKMRTNVCFAPKNLLMKKSPISCIEWSTWNDRIGCIDRIFYMNTLIRIWLAKDRRYWRDMEDFIILFNCFSNSFCSFGWTELVTRVLTIGTESISIKSYNVYVFDIFNI